MEVCRQGFWASLTGGWYYDPASSKFCNTLHLYLWLYLFISPCLLGYLFDSNLTDINGFFYNNSIYFIILYIGTIFILFLFIKFTIFHFHTIFDNNEPCKSIVVKRKTKKIKNGLQTKNMIKQPVRRRSRTSRRTSMPPGKRSNPRVDLMIPIKTIEQINALRERNFATLNALDDIQLRYNNRNTRASSIHEFSNPNQSQNNSNNISKDITPINKIEEISSTPGPSGLSISDNERIKERKFSDPAESIFHLPDDDNSAIRRTYSLYLPKTSIKNHNNEKRENLKFKHEEENYDDIPITITEMLNETCDEIKNETKEECKDKNIKRLLLPSRIKRRSKGEWIPETVDINFAMDVLPIEQRKIATMLNKGEILSEDNWFVRALNSLGEIDFLNSLDKGCTESTILKCEIISFMETLQKKYPIAFPFLNDIIQKIHNTIPTETVNEDKKNNINNDFTDILDPDQPGPSNINLLSQGGNNLRLKKSLEDKILYDGNLHLVKHKNIKKNNRSSFHFQYPDFPTRYQPIDVPEYEKDLTKNNGCDLEYDVRNIITNLMKSSYNHNFNDNIDGPSTKRVKIQHHNIAKKIITRHTDHLSIHSILTLSDDDIEKNNFCDGNQRYTNTTHQQERDNYWRSDSSLSSIVNNQQSFRTNFRGLTSFIETFQNTRNRGNKKRQQSSDGLRYRIANYYEFRFCPKCLLHIHKTTNSTTNSNSNNSENEYCKKFPSIRLQMDRLYIMSLFDKNKNIYSCIIDIIIAGVISILTSIIFYCNIYNGVSIYFYSFVVAGAHFSLLKSVQPDTSSPVHGFNWIASYSRPFYFTSISILLLCINYIEISKKYFNYIENDSIYIFGLEKTTFHNIIYFINSYFYYLLLFIPFASMLGTLPQITTLFMHLFEQFDMYFFGGTATFSLNSSIISIIRSFTTLCILIILSILAFNYSRDSTDNLFFSLYNASIISFSYGISRYSSNYSLIFLYLKNILKDNPIKKLRDAIIRIKIRNRNGRRRRNRKNTNPLEKGDKNKSFKSNILFNTSSIINDSKEEFTENVEMKELLGDDGENPAFQGIKDTYINDVLNTIGIRFQHDLFSMPFIMLIFFALHSTLLFHILQPWLERIFVSLSIIIGFYNHYLYPHFRAKNPWKVLINPIFKPAEFFEFESKEEAGVTLFEKIHLYLLFIERNIIYPLLITSLSSTYTWKVPFYPPIISTIILFKISRTAYSQPYNLYSSLFFTYLLMYYDFSRWYGEFGNEIIIWYLLTIMWPKIQEFRLKLDFIFAYIAPWQISWGSAFHAFVQPFSAPHSGFLTLVTFISSILSAPLNPFLGSSFFLMSYMRPIKFWEKDYNTKQYDFTNAKLCDQMESNPTVDDSNLNAVFYEHMTRSLQKYLAGDLAMGRWGSKVEQGDCFLLTSLNMNCLVHVIEVGNGFVTFQLRGLEFHGTYCHQREVEAISEDPPDIGKFFCFYFKGLFGFLPINTMLSFKWMAWEVTASKYIIDGYSITDNSAINLLQVHELRRLLVTLYVKSIIYYALNSKKFYDWISNTNIRHSLKEVIMRTFYFDDDSFHFNSANDEDFDTRKRGISRVSFNSVYKKWILFCLNKTIGIKHPKGTKAINDTNLITAFCFALSLVGRRILSSAAYSHHSTAAEAFLHGLHSMFKGDFRVTATQDEWVFEDLSILNKVISPAVRMALKLHQDHFASSDDLDIMETLYLKIGNYHKQIFISHEHDPLWRSAVMANIPSLLALRHVFDDGTNDFKVIMLNKMYLNMRVIKLNKECVRAFWAGQQQELIFLRNRNAERGSIQNAKQVLRNMINSSADQPIGYPIYVSPLTTSYVETHHQIEEILGGSFSINNIVSFIQKGITFVRDMLTTSNSTNMTQNNFDGREPISIIIGDRSCDHQSIDNSKNVIKQNKNDQELSKINICDKSKEKYPSASYHVRTPSGNNVQNVVLKLVPGSKIDSVTKVYHSVNDDDDDDDVLSTGSVKISKEEDSCFNIEDEKDEENIDVIEKDEDKFDMENVINDIGVKNDDESLFIKTRSKRDIGKWAKIVDNKYVQDHLNEKMKSLNRYIVLWPSEEWRLSGGLKNWPFLPNNGLIGKIVHVWSPFNPDPMYRSHAGFIYLIKIKLPVKDLQIIKDSDIEKKDDDQNLNVVYVPILEEGIILVNKDNN
ncbi:Pecanex family-containing protein [Strongyloides ratti]|uniref:Pecanex-like protein n=1 Tax=Strongyloides ratti TaxID=34506 RepID=A0A090KSS2_STRRB|nr:Pecanex family-containing protein [Strongyloides ratti]CEF60456.1 Pecanex family-containing protein [Strongyloides ratti]